MSIVKEFKDFALRGNVIDLAVGVIIGAAFGKIVTGLVDEIIMPPIGLAIGKVDFTNLYLPLDAKVPGGLALVEAKKLGPVIAYGSFLNSLIQFLIVAAVVFFLVKTVNRLQPKEEPAPAPAPEPTAEEKLLVEIRDLLKAGR